MLAVVLPVVLACAAAISVFVGAAVYSREGAHDSAATTASRADDAHLPADEVDVVGAPATGGAPAPRASAKTESTSLVPAAAGTYREIKIEIGTMGVDYDDTGIEQTSLPLRVTNTGDTVRSFDITVAARDEQGAQVTEDTGTAANLFPGQSAEVRVLDLVNGVYAEKLKTASFTVTDVFAY